MSVYFIFLSILNIKFPNLPLYNDFNDIKNYEENEETEEYATAYFELSEKLQLLQNQYDYLNNMLSNKNDYIIQLRKHVQYLSEEEDILVTDVKTYKDIFEMTLSVGDVNKIIEDIYPFVRSISDRYLLSMLSSDYDTTKII